MRIFALFMILFADLVLSDLHQFDRRTTPPVQRSSSTDPSLSSSSKRINRKATAQHNETKRTEKLPSSTAASHGKTPGTRMGDDPILMRMLEGSRRRIEEIKKRRLEGNLTPGKQLSTSSDRQSPQNLRSAARLGSNSNGPKTLRTSPLQVAASGRGKPRAVSKSKTLPAPKLSSASAPRVKLRPVEIDPQEIHNALRRGNDHMSSSPAEPSTPLKLSDFVYPGPLPALGASQTNAVGPVRSPSISSGRSHSTNSGRTQDAASALIALSRQPPNPSLSYLEARPSSHLRRRPRRYRDVNEVTWDPKTAMP